VPENEIGFVSKYRNMQDAAPMKTALAITHIAFEDLGTIEGALLQAGYSIERCDARAADLTGLDPCAYDLAVVLGGPMGVYERDRYPFITSEIEFLRSRLASAKPTLGICFGAQLMAAALGARVYPGSNGKEIGWKPLQPGAHAAEFPAMANLLAGGLPVLHWHGDTFDLPAGARHMAASDLYPNQAFSVGRFALALQFHLEATAEGLERWYAGHAAELAHAGIDVSALRRASELHAPALKAASGPFWQEWLSGVA
jgi:GMP synthase (glutamine-hydrolysing)